MWMALAPIAMLFAAFASAYVVRRGLGAGWVPIQIPTIVWGNTLVLLASSATLEAGRRAESRGDSGARLLWVTFALGALFLAGQVAAWLQLSEHGVGVGTTPHGSFFYLLTGTHGVHLLGGVAALLLAGLWPRDRWRRISRDTVVRVTAIYWHFMGILWVGILLLLVLWR
jgi:cytochrome c oxidase subunit 3